MNPDKALIRRFQAAPQTPLAIDSNPLAAALNGHILSVDANTGRILLAFSPGPAFLQGNGMVQGGIVSTMLDFAAAFAAFARLPDEQVAYSVSLTISYLAPVAQGELRARATIGRIGRRLAFVRAELLEANGTQLLATAESVLAVMPDQI